MIVHLHGGPWDGFVSAQQDPVHTIVMASDAYKIRRGQHLTDEPVHFDYVGYREHNRAANAVAEDAG